MPGEVRDRPEIAVLECEACGLVFLESMDHINAGYYEESGMHTGGDALPIQQWLKECYADDLRRYEFLREVAVGKDLLDFGAGAGGFARLIQPLANTVSVLELENRLQEHYDEMSCERFAGIEHLPSDKRFDLITLFHVMEHLPDPRETLKQLARHLKPAGRMVIEVPNANDALLKLYESEPFSRFTYWSCHLFLFTNATLRRLVEQAGLKLIFIKQIQRYSMANHMHWLSRGKPGGHQKWSFLDSRELHSAYEKQLASMGLCDTLIAWVELG